VPERLVGSRSRKWKGRYPWQPWKWEPPQKAATNWHCHTDRKDSPKYKANDLQQSAGSTVRAMQCDTTALQISKGPPGKPDSTFCQAL